MLGIIKMRKQMITAQNLYDKLKNVSIGGSVCQYTLEVCEQLIIKVNKINKLKKEKNAVILVHSYVTPEIIYGVADYVGDSYYLSKCAKESKAEIIVFVAVKFMGDTAKILSPDKEVYIPSALNGCSLADSITGEQVAKLKQKYPEHTFVCYINTTAEVKAFCDVCVTSSNVYDIVEKIDNDKIYFLPDKLMGENIIEEMEKRGVDKEILLWDGTCYVHEDYTPEMIQYLKLENPNIKTLSHPECSPGVLSYSDYVGSTSSLLNYIQNSKEKDFLLLTECGLTSRLQVELPDKNFIGTCSMCKYMKANTLDDILDTLEDMAESKRIKIEKKILEKAQICINKMFEYTD